jgi:hypothetical protein
MTGPGGYYNVGNALALLAGLGVQIADVGSDAHAPGGLAAAIGDYFAGSPGATALSVAMLIFFASGEMYHRAWAAGFPPDLRANRWGDLLSGVGALALTVALAAFGDVLLAAVSGVLLAGGKLGSALVPEDYAAPRRDPLADAFRIAVLGSRAPAVVAMALQLAAAIGAPRADLSAAVMSGVMLVCYLLWARADLLLVASARR